MGEVDQVDRDLIRRAQALADDELFPRANEADRAEAVPEYQLNLLAEAGLYEAATKVQPETMTTLIEIISSGCLATGFVWTQHSGASRAAHNTDGVANRFAARLATGELRGGVAFAHMLRPDPPLSTATPADDGWLLHGTAPWVTGWGHIDLLLAAARHGDDIVWSLIDATEQPTLTANQPQIAVINSTQTVELTYRAHPVPTDRVTQVIARTEWLAGYRRGLRDNGAFPLAVARRACQLLESENLERRLIEHRQALDEADTATIEQERAKAALFAVHATTALVTATGGRAVMVTEHAQRLHREAMFLLVQGQTPRIKAEILNRLGY